MLKKEEARSLAKKYRRSLSRTQLALISKKISQRIITIPEFEIAENIGLYYPIAANHEVDILSILQVSNKTFGLPKVKGKHMNFVHFSLGDPTITGRFGQMEPVSRQIISFSKSDCVIIPMLYGSLQGERIGYGGGYYDRFLSHVEVVKIGVVMENCLAERLESHSHDVKLDMIATESALYRSVDFN